jgi:predicted nucleic acid-binding protein
VKYLFDTCLVSEWTRKKPEAAVRDWLAQCDEESAYLSVLTVGEIQKGIARCGDPARKTSSQKWLDGDLRKRFLGRVLPITEEVAKTWGLFQGEAEARGKSIPSIDGLIAATAAVHNLILVTRNEADMALSGVRIVNPWPR